MSKKELVTPEQLRIAAAEMRASAQVLEDAANDLEAEGGEGLEIGATTAARRIDELGGFARTVQRKTDQQLANIRRQRAKLVSKRKKLN